MSLVIRHGLTTLIMVDVAAQNPLYAAVSTKSDEIAYLTAMCGAFARRMAYANAVLKVDPEPALRSLADRIAVGAIADWIQLKVQTAPRFSSQSIGAVGRAQDAVEGQIRCLRLRLETRLSLEVTPAMDVWPRLVRHAGWFLGRYRVKADKETAFEDRFGKAYQGEVMKFAEAVLFRVAVSPSGKIRDGVRQGRADGKFVRGIKLGKTEQKRADSVRSLQRTPWDRVAGRPSGKTSQDSSCKGNRTSE